MFLLGGPETLRFDAPREGALPPTWGLTLRRLRNALLRTLEKTLEATRSVRDLLAARFVLQFLNGSLYLKAAFGIFSHAGRGQFDDFSFYPHGARQLRGYAQA